MQNNGLDTIKSASINHNKNNKIEGATIRPNPNKKNIVRDVTINMNPGKKFKVGNATFNVNLNV